MPSSETNPLLPLCEQILNFLAAALISLLLGLGLAALIDRYVMESGSLWWAPTASRLLLTSLACLAIPILCLEPDRFAFKALRNLLPAIAQQNLDAVNEGFISLTLAIITSGSWHIMQRIGGFDPVFGLPGGLQQAPLFLAASAGWFLLLRRRFAVFSQDQSRSQAYRSALPFWSFTLFMAALGFGAEFLYSLEIYSFVYGKDYLFMWLGGFFALGLVLGLPLPFILLLTVSLTDPVQNSHPWASWVKSLSDGTRNPLLLAIPFFITAGFLMNAGGLSQKLIDLAAAWVGKWRGGLAQITIVTSGLYSGLSGSSFAEATLGGRLLAPQMIRHGIQPAQACAVIAASAVLPNIIPPSIALLILAMVADLSVGSLWLAGIGPGLVMLACLMFCVYLQAGAGGPFAGHIPSNNTLPPRHALIQAIPIFGLAILIIASIRFGLVTPTEAGLLAAAYAWILGMMLYRTYNLRQFGQILAQAGREAALIVFLIAAAMPFATKLILEDLPNQLAQQISIITNNPILLMLLANLMMLAFGMILDIGAAILILTPLLMPIITAAGFEPIHFGIIIVVNLMLGGLTPPVGMLALILANATRTPVYRVFQALFPFILALLFALILIACFPFLSLGALWFADII